MRVLALNPFHAGSHRAFLDGWCVRSRHRILAMTLPGQTWKWRMRHAAVELAERARVEERGPDRSSAYDAVFATGMMNLAEWRGLCPGLLARTPTVLYMHENQFAYPVREAPGNEPRRDLHFAMTNLVSALAADRVWFNSEHNRTTFFSGARELLSKFADADGAPLLRAEQRSRVIGPGIDAIGLAECGRGGAGPRGDGPLRILWNHRWEHDKDPSTFVAALRLLRKWGVRFRLTVLGETHESSPPDSARTREEFGSSVEHWGYAESRAEYADRLRASDVVVSTARHEFFGLAVLEAASAGCVPCVPAALAYPETLELGTHKEWTHDGTSEGVADRLRSWSEVCTTDAFAAQRAEAARAARRHDWAFASVSLDEALGQMVSDSEPESGRISS